MSKQVLTHAGNGDTRDAYAGDGSYGSLGKTLCGKWLPMWEDGPDGGDNAARWDEDEPTCPTCATALDEE